jgi:hypothetical protein
MYRVSARASPPIAMEADQARLTVALIIVKRHREAVTFAAIRMPG